MIIPEEPNPLPHQHILNIVMGFWQSRCLAVATELDLAEQLASGPLPVDVLATRTATDSLSLFRLLRALESIAVFQQVSPGVFANTPASECLRRHAPASQWASVQTILSVGHGQYEAWSGLMESIQTGKAAFDTVHGSEAWEWYQQRPEVISVFNETMQSLSAVITPAVSTGYDWSRFALIADIGGGIGTQLAAILNAHPSCRGVLFDQPSVIQQAPKHDRMDRIGGDFFHSVPADADAYILRWIIHDWADSPAIAILTNVRKAMKPTARLLLIEEIVPEPSQPTMGMWLDPHMLVMHNGRERTRSEYASLYERAGFDLEEVVPTASPHSIIIGSPRA
jgi:O-methyltransferase domain/Dimerisation domain